MLGACAKSQRWKKWLLLKPFTPPKTDDVCLQNASPASMELGAFLYKCVCVYLMLY